MTMTITLRFSYSGFPSPVKTLCTTFLLLGVSRLYPGHTKAATILRLYCDRFFDQIAVDRSKVSLRSQYGRSVVVVDRTSRRTVAVAILIAVRNFGMFKIPHCDFSIAVQSVCCRSAVAQLALWSQYDLPALSRCAWSRLAREYCDCTAILLMRMNCHVVTLTITQEKTWQQIKNDIKSIEIMEYLTAIIRICARAMNCAPRRDHVPFCIVEAALDKGSMLWCFAMMRHIHHQTGTIIWRTNLL